MHTCSLSSLSPCPGLNHLFVFSWLYMLHFLQSLLYCPNCHARCLAFCFFRPLKCFHPRQISSPPIVDLPQIHPCSLKCLAATLAPNLGAHQPPPLTSPMACTLSQEEVCPKVREWDSLVGHPRVSRCRATKTPQHPLRPCLAIPKHPHPTRPCPHTEEVMEEVHLPPQLSM